MIYNNILKNQSGYSVIESLTALALLTAVLLPACALTARLVSNHMVQSKVTAIIMAEKIMEQTIAEKELVSREWRTRRNHVDYKIRRIVEMRHSITFIRVEIISERNNKCVFFLQTCRPFR